ncbi:MAG: FAD-binding oxidoreductase, partial [Ruminococcus sp.]|nr:FAD-binding oxidoreductase [Ruminococcus sp.]
MESIWSMETNFQKRPKLTEDIRTRVAVIGAGISGILTAYFLQQEGIDCVVVDKGSICDGQTKNTTAKITFQHADI